MFKKLNGHLNVVCLLPVLFILLNMSAPAAHAHGWWPERTYNYGVGISRDAAKNYRGSIEGTGSYEIFWLSVGTQFSSSSFRPYAEVGLWFLANVGTGVTWDTAQNSLNPHFFTGVPLPLFIKTKVGSPFIEPYYRYTWRTDAPHEFGALLKFVVERSPEAENTPVPVENSSN